MFNDIPTERFQKSGKDRFRFDVGFYAGDLRLTVVQGSRILAAADSVIDPDLAKLTREEYAELLADIARATQALYRLGAVTIPAAVGPAGFRSDVVTLDLVRANFETFESAVQQIAEHPHRILRTQSTSVDIMSARRLDHRAINKALRSGKWRMATESEMHAAPQLVAALGGRWIPKVFERQRADRLDIYEHSALLGFMQWLERWILDITRRIAAAQSTINQDAAPAWIHRLKAWRHRLAALQQQSVFSGVAPEYSLQSTSLFQMSPEYARAYSAMVKIRSGLGPSSLLAPAVPIDQTYALYEIWCYIKILEQAATAFPSSHSDVAQLLQGLTAPNELGSVLSRGDASAVRLRPDLTLHYQRRFRNQPDGSGCKTNTVEAIPDVTLARTDANARCIGMIVIDPKYRGGQSLSDGLRDLHAYRDNIIGDADKRLVVGAVALAPRASQFAWSSGQKLPSEKPVVMEACPQRDAHVFPDLLQIAIDTLL